MNDYQLKRRHYFHTNFSFIKSSHQMGLFNKTYKYTGCLKSFYRLRKERSYFYFHFFHIKFERFYISLFASIQRWRETLKILERSYMETEFTANEIYVYLHIDSFLFDGVYSSHTHVSEGDNTLKKRMNACNEISNRSNFVWNMR